MHAQQQTYGNSHKTNLKKSLIVRPQYSLGPQKSTTVTSLSERILVVGQEVRDIIRVVIDQHILLEKRLTTHIRWKRIS
jgi:hypothetical protein